MKYILFISLLAMIQGAGLSQTTANNEILLESYPCVKINNYNTVSYQGLDPRTGRIYYRDGQIIIIDGRRPLKPRFHEYSFVEIVYLNGTPANFAYSELKNYGKEKMKVSM